MTVAIRRSDDHYELWFVIDIQAPEAVVKLLHLFQNFSENAYGSLSVANGFAASVRMSLGRLSVCARRGGVLLARLGHVRSSVLRSVVSRFGVTSIVPACVSNVELRLSMSETKKNRGGRLVGTTPVTGHIPPDLLTLSTVTPFRTELPFAPRRHSPGACRWLQWGLKD